MKCRTCGREISEKENKLAHYHVRNLTRCKYCFRKGKVWEERFKDIEKESEEKEIKQVHKSRNML